ncbi:glycosyltransferase [Microbacterium sp. MC2]
MPAASIVVPLYNDEAWVARALHSCLSQTRRDIEVICVDDASADNTSAIVAEFAVDDDRIRLIQLESNQSAFQARRVGVEAASAPFVMFLDGDDELRQDAVAVAIQRATQTKADVVGFGVDVRSDDGARSPRFERSLQPKHSKLVAPNIVRSLFPADAPAQGHLWRYLWKTELLRRAYAGSTSDEKYYRANDIPVTFLALAAASKYASTPEKLYLYHFRRGTSGHGVTDVEKFRFYLGAIDAISSIGTRVRSHAVSPSLMPSYESARRSIMGNILRYLVDDTEDAIRKPCFQMLRDRVADDIELLRAAAVFCPESIELFAERGDPSPRVRHEARSVLLTTGNLRAGGVQGVLTAQAHHLRDAGFIVTVAVFDPAPAVYELPPDVMVVHAPGGSDSDRILWWSNFLRNHQIDVVIDHHILYNRRWPLLAIAAQCVGVKTIGWLHNFALRPMADRDDRISFLLRNLPYLETVVVLSQADVAFWKLQGINNVVWLPNPIAHLEPAHGTVPHQRQRSDRIELAWWGRLQQGTKQVRDLVQVGERLAALGVDFHLSIIGPDSPDLTARQVVEEARKRGIEDRVTLTGALHGDALAARIQSAHLLLLTSVIEGYPLTLVEAQANGLPVIMYELPWLAYVQGNDAIVSVPQGDKWAMAEAVAELAQDEDRYAALSRAALEAARRALSHDFASLYTQLVRGALPGHYSPSPTGADSALLLRWAVFFAERNARITRREVGRLENRLRDSLRLSRELKDLKSGWSFRLGRTITSIPRRVRALTRL